MGQPIALSHCRQKNKRGSGQSHARVARQLTQRVGEGQKGNAEDFVRG